MSWRSLLLVGVCAAVPAAAADDGPESAEPGSREAIAAATTEPLAMSGGVKGAAEIEGKPAILDVPVGKGRIVAFDFDPLHRYQTMSDFRLVWNAVLNWNDLPPVPKTKWGVRPPGATRISRPLRSEASATGLLNPPPAVCYA